jgi:hypothetical protein
MKIYKKFDLINKNGIKIKINAYTEDIKLIEISFFNEDVIIDVIGKVNKIKKINPSVYVILKLSYINDSRIDNLLNVIEDASKDMIDELYLLYEFSSYKQMNLYLNLFKKNPKLKKCYIHKFFKQSDFRYLKNKATNLLEN